MSRGSLYGAFRYTLFTTSMTVRSSGDTGEAFRLQRGVTRLVDEESLRSKESYETRFLL